MAATIAPLPPDRRDLRRWVRPGLYRGGASGRRLADDRAVAAGGVLCARRGGDADLHEPEQSVDRDRRAAVGARHLGQFRARPRQRRRDHDDRPGDGARRHDPWADVAGRGRGRRDHRERQIAPHARQGDRDRPLLRAMAASVFRPNRRIAARSGSTASTASRLWSAARSPTCIRPICRCSCSMPA